LSEVRTAALMIWKPHDGQTDLRYANIADDGNFECSAPDDEVFAFISGVLRPIGTYLYGRRTYETMAVWETPDVIPGLKPFMLGFARRAVRDLKAQSPHDVSVGLTCYR